MEKKRCPICHKDYELTAKFCQFDAQLLEVVTEDWVDPLIGIVLDNKYQIELLIGKGSMGDVYKGKHLMMDIPVAIKVLHSNLTSNENAVEHFRREARSALAVNHSNIMSVMDIGVTADKIFYLVMEYIKGISLAELLENGPLEILPVYKIIKQVCAAVHSAHQKNIIHRDLKPDNILIIDRDKPSERVKVIDFSFAKSYKLETGESSSPTTTNISSALPEYISPEQADGNTLDPRSDIYSLGVIIYKMLTGVVPFEGKTAAVVLRKHIQEAPRPLREIRQDLPVIVEDMVLRALAKKPDERYQTAAELSEAFEQALVALEMLSAPASTSEPAAAPVEVKESPVIAPQTAAEITKKQVETADLELPEAAKPIVKDALSHITGETLTDMSPAQYSQEDSNPSSLSSESESGERKEEKKKSFLDRILGR